MTKRQKGIAMRCRLNVKRSMALWDELDYVDQRCRNADSTPIRNLFDPKNLSRVAVALKAFVNAKT
jgi:hypothetical protein